MDKAQRPAILFQQAGLRARVARLPRRVRLALYTLAALALLWLLGLPQAGYRHLYVWLAYPVAWVLDMAQGVGGPSWAAWTRDIDGRYAWLHTPAHGGLGWAILVEILLPLVPVGAMSWRVGWFLYTRPRPLTPSTAHGSARYMTRAEMQKLPYTGGPFLLGERGGVSAALDWTKQVLNILLVGPPNTGKSAALIIANLRRERGARSVVAIDLKNELLRKCYGALRRNHEVWVVNVLSPETSLGYNPLAYCTDPLATALFCDAWIANTGGNEKDPFWDNAARELMLAGIFHLQEVAARAGRSPLDVPLAHLDEFLTGRPPQAVIAALEESPARLARKKAFSFMASLKANDKLLGSVFAEITPRFMILSDPRVQAVTSTNEVDFRRMATAEGKPIALFLGVDRTLKKQLKPLYAAFFLDMFRTFSRLADESPTDELGRGVFIYGDEFGNIGQIPEMATWVSTLRSAGVGGVWTVQHIGQLRKLYPDDYGTILASAYTKIGLSHMELEDAKWFSEQAGQKTEVTQSTNTQRGRFHVTTDRGGASQSETKSNLLNPDEVQRIEETEMIVLVGERPPLRLRQRRYYEDPEVMDLSEAVPPLGPARDGGPLASPPPLEMGSPAPIAAQAAEPEHERVGDDPAADDDQAGDTGAGGVTADASGEEPAVDDGWVGGLSASDEPDVDR